MAADDLPPRSFNYSSMDWDAYIRFRPVYPEPLYSTIYAYHHSHGAGYDAAVDVGAGVGIVSKELLKRFSRVTITDPTETYVAQARAFFAAVPPERVSIVHAKAEELRIENLGGQRFDLLTAAECLHWADVEAAEPRFASVLKPGATLAIWLYGPRPLLREHSTDLREASRIFYEIYDAIAVYYDSHIELQDATTAAARMNARLDHMDLPPERWTDVRRTYAHADEPMMHPRWPTKASSVRVTDRREQFADQDLLRHEADYEYLAGYLANVVPVIDTVELAGEQLARLKEAMGDRRIWLTWPLVLILATRK